MLQRHVLYLGEINSSQELAWRKSIEVFEDGAASPRTLWLFPDNRSEELSEERSVTSLAINGIETSIERVLVLVLKNLEAKLQALASNPRSLCAEFLAALDLEARPVRVELGGRTHRGRLQALSLERGIELEQEDGTHSFLLEHVRSLNLDDAR